MVTDPPVLVPGRYRNNITAFDLREMPGQVDTRL